MVEGLLKMVVVWIVRAKFILMCKKDKLILDLKMLIFLMILGKVSFLRFHSAKQVLGMKLAVELIEYKGNYELSCLFHIH